MMVPSSTHHFETPCQKCKILPWRVCLVFRWISSCASKFRLIESFMLFITSTVFRWFFKILTLTLFWPLEALKTDLLGHQPWPPIPFPIVLFLLFPPYSFSIHRLKLNFNFGAYFDQTNLIFEHFLLRPVNAVYVASTNLFWHHLFRLNVKV